MSYSCQEEYDYYMGAQAEAEAEAEQQAQYEKYLSEISESDPYLFALEVSLDMLCSKEFKSSGLTFEEFLIRKKQKHLKPKEVDGNPTLPF
jgi:hypothetical protein